MGELRTVTCACGASTELELPGDVECAMCPECASKWSRVPSDAPVGSWVLVPKPPQFASGGVITGPLPSGDDGAPVMLSPGYWLRRDAVEALGGSGEVLRALNDAVGGPVELDREYSEEELRNSPYRDVMRDAVVAGPDEYRSGPPDGLGQRGE